MLNDTIINKGLQDKDVTMHCYRSCDIFIAYCRLCDDRRSAFTVSQIRQPDYQLQHALFMLETYGTIFKLLF